MAQRVAQPHALSMRSLRRISTFASAPLLTGGLLWGCAQSGIADLGPDIDPTLPEVDASWSPSPDTPSAKVPEPSKRDTEPSEADEADESEPDEPSSPPTAAAPDAGGPDTTNPNTPSASKPSQGEVLITEVMYDPFGNEPASEWIELHNRTSGTRTLSGLTIVDGGNRTHVIGAGISIAPGAYVVLARSRSSAISAKVPAAVIVYEYGAGLPSNAGIQLANGNTGGVWLRDGTTTIAQADYGGWYSQSGGSSIQLRTLTYPASGQSGNWCISLNEWTTDSDKGTPGAPNDCP